MDLPEPGIKPGSPALQADTLPAKPPRNPTREFVKDTHRLKWRKWKKIFYGNGNKKKAEVTILVSHKIGFKK